MLRNAVPSGLSLLLTAVLAAGCASGGRRPPPRGDSGPGRTDTGTMTGDTGPPCAADSECDDGLACNGAETCAASRCVAGTPVDCDDGVACTADVCNDADASCVHTPDDAMCPAGLVCDETDNCVAPTPCETDADCDDAQMCNGAETCEPAFGCRRGTAPTCDDSIACTVDTCDEAGAGGTGACVNTATDTLCDDGSVCTIGDTCAPGGAGADPTTGCVTGVAMDCADAHPCTTDACDPVAGCTHTADSSVCSDGVFCNGAEVCDPATGCGPGTPPDCADAIGCTDGRCDMAMDRCVQTANPTFCADGMACNGAEVCDTSGVTPGSGCVPGVPVDCNDGLACTTDSCVEPGGTCTNRGTDVDRDGFTAVGCAGGNDCDDTQPSVYPGASEVCDGVDNNCNGTADDGGGLECALGSGPRACTTACTTPGTQTCSSACRLSACRAASETCNDCDDDSNGAVDDGLACRRGTTSACTTSCATPGLRTCASDCSGYSACVATETCNDCDDDGDGMPDDGLPCRRGTTTSCTTTCGTSGTQRCAMDCSGYSACVAATETCNDCDDDGDGIIDDGFTCRRGTTRPCTTSCGTGGVETCNGTCSGYGACAATTETCNGCDDNGNGVPDDGLACVMGSSRACTTPCGTSGTESCNGTCTGYNRCNAATETCGNACDDDGDGMTDEGCMPPGPTNDMCTGAIPVNMTGMGTTITGSTVGGTNQAGCGSGPDIYYSFTLTRREVIYIDTEGSSYDTEVAIATACTGFLPGACNDDSCFGLQSQLVQVLNPGSYYLIVGGFGGSSGSFTLRFQHLPTGNMTPIVLTRGAGLVVSGTTSGTGQLTTTCGSAGGPEQMYYYTTCAYAGGAVSATTCSRASWDTQLYFRDARAGTEACIDDSCGLQSTLSATASGGAGLRALYIDGFGVASGAYSIQYTVP